MAESETDKVAFELVSPERLLVTQDADMVVVPGEEGDFGVLPGHALFMSSLRSGVVEIHDAGEITDRVFVAGGFAEVTPKRCTVLAEEAISLGDVDRGSADARLKDAEQAISDASDDDERAKAEAARDVALALIEALEAQ
ncbi:MAG: F0F1 ATP synthase subunit epsilon [Alphaproteobacteria bacterium]|jgi:F-type H+-transporting ATPase subunit epsilon